MNINKQRSKTKKIVLISANIVAALVILGVMYWFTFQKPQQDSANQHPKVSQQNDEQKAQSNKNVKDAVSTEEQSKSDYINNAIENEKTNSPATPPAPDSSYITLTATTEADTVILRTSLGSVSAGTCSLAITNGNITKDYTTDILYQPQNSSCAGFSVPVSDIGRGKWTLKLTVLSNNQTATKEITHTVK